MQVEVILFELNGNDIYWMSLEGASISEIKPTLELLACERGCNVSDINMRIGMVDAGHTQQDL